MSHSRSIFLTPNFVQAQCVPVSMVLKCYEIFVVSLKFLAMQDGGEELTLFILIVETHVDPFHWFSLFYTGCLFDIWDVEPFFDYHCRYTVARTQILRDPFRSPLWLSP